MDVEAAHLREIQSVLYLLYHRNKNQHRQSKWWKYLSILRRCVGKLAKEIEAKDTERANTRSIYLKDFLLPRCHMHFTQLIQDNQFAALGLALFAELAKTQRAIYSPSTQSEEIKAGRPKNIKSSNILEISEDLGEALGRSIGEGYTVQDPNVSSTVEISTGSQHLEIAETPLFGPEKSNFGAADHNRRSNSKKSTPVADGRPQASPKLIKRQKKPVNAIDDLFYGLD